jgi:3-dehydroquinate synthase
MHIFSSTNYSIEIGDITQSSFAELLSSKYGSSRIVIIVDENTHDQCLEYLLTSFDPLKEAEVMLLPVGEENKVMEVCFQVWEALSEYKIGRRDLIINLGGGVVTDMGGFIAAIFKRGVDFIHIPTTLLGMVDASIGGKTGIDLGPFKNQLGVFKHPKMIYIDPIFLGTLPEEEILNGFSEMVKHALILDKDLFNELVDLTSIEELTALDLIARTSKIKVDIVEQDPEEIGIRKLLNFGHTIGHGIEGYLLEVEPIAHGHAVALGMLAESFVSFRRGSLSNDDFQMISELILKRYPMIEFTEEMIAGICELCLNDKKNDGNKINCTLLNGIGKGEIDQYVDASEITLSLEFLNQCSK